MINGESKWILKKWIKTNAWKSKKGREIYVKLNINNKL